MLHANAKTDLSLCLAFSSGAILSALVCTFLLSNQPSDIQSESWYSTNQVALSALVANCKLDSAWMSCPYSVPGQKARPFSDYAEALSRMVGNAAQLSEDDVVVDVGCGYGDQDFLFVNEFSVKQIIGIDITLNEVKIANHRAQQLGFDHVEFLHGDAVEMTQVSAASVDKVIAVNTAFHFKTRQDFVRRAWHVLKPGGLLVLVDQVGRDNTSLTLLKKDIPPENVCLLPEYIRMLKAEGFADVSVTNITDNFVGPCQGTTLPPASPVVEAFETVYPGISANFQWVPGTDYYAHARLTHNYMFVARK
jgi:SAM-dependent methyltransferase